MGFFGSELEANHAPGITAFSERRYLSIPGSNADGGHLGGSRCAGVRLPSDASLRIAASIATFAFLVVINSVYSNWD